MATLTRFSFLTAGPTFQLELPDDFESLPELSSPLGFDGYRSFDFLPQQRDDSPGESLRLLNTLRDRDGRNVELYERLEPPPQWYLRWPLSNGALYTHLREAEGPERAAIHVSSLAIVERRGVPPFLLPEPPLRSGVSATPGYQEFAIFASLSRQGWWVVLQRPGYLGPGKVMRSPDSSQVVLRSGARFGIEVAVFSGNDVHGGRELNSTVLNSLREA